MKNIFSIWQNKRQGNQTQPSGFEERVAPHIEQLYRLAYRFSGNRYDAEDLVQELLIRMYPRSDELAGIEALGPWLSKSLYHLFIDLHRRKIASPVVLVEDMGMEMATVACGNAAPDEMLARAQTSARLGQALSLLNMDQRTLIAMHDMEGYSLPELSSMLETPLGTLKSRLHRARASLREYLTEK